MLVHSVLCTAGHIHTRLQKQGLAHLLAEAVAYAGTGKLWFANPPGLEGFHTLFPEWDGLEEKQRKTSRHEHTETVPPKYQFLEWPWVHQPSFEAENAPVPHVQHVPRIQDT